MINEFWNDIIRVQQEFDRFFASKALMGHVSQTPTLWKPAMTDIKETDHEVIASFDLPGTDKKDIELNVDENHVSLKAERKAEVKKEEKGYYRHERSHTGFYRHFALPSKVIPEKANAEYKDGVLTVSMPKAEPKKVAGVRRLQIK